MDNLDQILKNFGESNRDICSIVTYGSLFHLDRQKSSAPLLSDLDLFIFTNDVKKYNDQNNTEWLSSFPSPVLSVHVQNADNLICTRVMFEDFFCIDFAILDKKLLLLLRRYIQLKKLKVFNFLLKKAGRTDNYIALLSHYLSSGYKIPYSHNKFYPVINEIAKNYRLAPYEFNEEAFKANYHGFWQYCYKIYIRIKKDDMLYAVLVADNSLKRIIIEVLIWREQLPTNNASAIFRGKNIKHWGNEYFTQIENGLMFTLNREEACSTLLKNISFYRSVCKDVSDWHLPELEESIISLLESEMNTMLCSDPVIEQDLN
ncbi:hypothetical protein AR687_24775 [Flavobacteriaceae bacterium CRH]|nr:hypothetical protein AR687_24775 [Flavobacteriaceae bacterium CRH]